MFVALGFCVRRPPKEDADHQLYYAKVLLDGTQWIGEGSFRNWLETGCGFVPKEGSHPSELADMFARDLYEWTKGAASVAPKRWAEFDSKIYCRGDGARGRFGVKLFPDSDIRDAIIEHRRRCGADLN